MFHKIDYGLSCAAWALVMPFSFSLPPSLSVFIFLSLCRLPPSFPPSPRFSSFLIPRAFYLLVMIAQGDVENKPTVGWGALDGHCIVLRNDAFSSRHKSYASARRYYARRIIETCIRKRKLSPFIFISLSK